MITLFYGGVVNLGRNMNVVLKTREPFVGIKEMAEADIRLVDLECVIAAKGEQQPLENHFYFRANPEQTNILAKNDIDIVLTANDHSGDYGADALLEQREYLDAAGILHAGSGKNISEAFAPVFKKVNDITVAIFSVDTIMPTFAATEDKPGTAYLPVDNLELWKETFTDKINAARAKADVVIVAPHWGANLAKKPAEEIRNLAHLLIDLGADAILGCNSHIVQGVEIYNDCPIIYDTGDLLFDWGKRNGGCFVLEISSDGVENVKFIPLVVKKGQTQRAGKSMEEIVWNFISLCNEFKTVTTTAEGGFVGIPFNPPPRDFEVVNDFPNVKQPKNLIAPLAEPKADWIVDKVPDEAIIPPQNFNGLKLVGCYVAPEYRTITERKMLFVETYWTIEEPLDKDCRLSIVAAPIRECNMPPFDSAEHELLDFMYPVERWKVGVIYRERIGLAPPASNQMANLNLQLRLRVKIDGEIVGEFKDPKLIVMNLPNQIRHYIDFDDIIYQSEPGKCWTAEQLAKVTGGTWIIPPPKGWYVQSFNKVVSDETPRPNLYVSGEKNSRDTVKKILANMDKFSGAIVAHDVTGLPPNFPVLKVDNPVFAVRELGFAARQRFQGKVIGVTGSAGKTTTCNMLNCVLSKDHNVLATPGSSNMYGIVPRIFAGVKQDDAYAIIELSIDAFEKVAGSLCYEIMPHVAVVTSITSAHIGRRGSLEVIANNKSRIFNGMSPGNYAVLNRDMPCYELFEQKAKSLKLRIITFGTRPDADVSMPVLLDGGEFFVKGKPYKLSCPVPAEQLYDALAVVAVSLAIGIPVEKILEYLKTFSPVSGRGNVMKITRGEKDLTIINSAYNANVDSIKYALQHLKNFEPNKKSRVAILGDIAALGSFSEKYHRELAQPMIDADLDRLLLCGEFMRYPYEMIKDKVNVTYFDSLNKLIGKVESYLQDGDTVLIKSSHDTGLSKVVDLLSATSE